MNFEDKLYYAKPYRVFIFGSAILFTGFFLLFFPLILIIPHPSFVKIDLWMIIIWLVLSFIIIPYGLSIILKRNKVIQLYLLESNLKHILSTSGARVTPLTIIDQENYSTIEYIDIKDVSLTTLRGIKITLKDNSTVFLPILFENTIELQGIVQEIKKRIEYKNNYCQQ